MRLRPLFGNWIASASVVLFVTGFSFHGTAAAPPQRSNEATLVPRAWTSELSVQVKIPANVSVSPDANRVVYTVSEPVMTSDKSTYDTQLYIANSDGTHRQKLTQEERPSSDPHWSPDGKWIAFTSAQSGKNNLFLVPGAGGKAEQITDVKTGISTFAWSPDGKQIAFIMSAPPTAETERRIREKEDVLWVDEETSRNALYTVKVPTAADEKQEPRRLTGNDYSVGSPFWAPGFDWSPDGKSIVFTCTKSAKANDWPTADLFVVDVATGVAKPVASTGAAETQPYFSPDGQLIAFTASDNTPSWSFATTIHIVTAKGGKPRMVGSTPDSNPTLIGWSKDGTKIYFSEIWGTLSRLYAMDVSSGSTVEVSQGNHTISQPSLNSTKTKFGFRMESLDTPPEVFVSDTATFAPIQVSDANAALPKLPLGKTDVVHWKSSDGTPIEGLLTYPVGYEPGTRVPLLLVIHGGPSGVHLQNFLPYAGSAYPLAALASRGYAILRPNPRGSSGYGKQFRASRKIWGDADFDDLMTGVDHVIGMGVADPGRLGVMGWSYGGFMTAWMITHTHRFKAASMGAAITNQIDNWGNTDLPGESVDYFGTFQDHQDAYIEHSPIFHTKGVSTPLLIQHGANDRTVPIAEAYEMFRALQIQGVPARMMVIPRSGHGIGEPKLVLQVFEENLKWFDKYLQSGH